MSENGFASILHELDNVLCQVPPDRLAALETALVAARRVFGAGAGRTGLMIKAFMMRLMQMGLLAYVAGETTTPGAGRGDWVVIASGSGETATVVAAARKAKAAGASIAALTGNPDSTLSRLADLIIEIPAAPPAVSGEASAGSPALVLGSPFELALLLTFESLVPSLMARLNVDEAAMMRMHANLE